MTLQDVAYPLCDVALARRLEDAEGFSSAEYVQVQSQLDPSRDATWVRVGGARAMYAGVDSPLTQTFGLGMHEAVREEDLDELEAFYRTRGASVQHEVSPLADPELLPLLVERAYRPIEFTSVMFRPIVPTLSIGGPLDAAIQVGRVHEENLSSWCATAVRGWSEYGDLRELMDEVARVTIAREGAILYLARLEGEPVAAGALAMHEGVALLAGASTVPEARRRGAQRALLERRLRDAAEMGCDLAMMCARPGSSSQRNAERHGFRIAYTRIKWQLAE
ncbi:MAG: GNAT family N-acetyltransferase [Planctomycetes bacterium]|nr:GNAT family N-acetyltransferase [Planctomycetota bacterium]